MESKICPKCNIFHTKTGKYCSRKCANSRIITEEHKLKIASALKNFYMTDDGEKLRSHLSLVNTDCTHTNETRQKISSSVSKSRTPEVREKLRIASTNRYVGDETRVKLSQHAIKNGLGGHTSKKKIYFNKNNGEVVYLQSSFEVRFAEILENLCIAWERPAPMMWVDDNNVTHRYYPDFKIDDVYVDTKNEYLAIVDLPKINKVREQNNINLHIVLEEQITEQYVKMLVGLDN